MTPIKVNGIRLSDAQAIALLRGHSTGDWGGFPWKTYSHLETLGLIDCTNKNMVVTAKGAAWCNDHHMAYDWARKPVQHESQGAYFYDKC